jgi:hypothetical protein
MGGYVSAGEHQAMRRNPLVNFHRSAETAGYPALLIVSMISLGLVVVPVALLALTRAGWVLALALLSVPLALAVLAAEIGAAFSESDESIAGPRARAPADRHGDSVAPLPRREPEIREDDRQRRAA